MEKIVSEVRIDMPLPTESCGICLNDNISACQMFSVGICRHRFCSECLKRHIETRLLEGRFLTCPHDGCNLKLLYKSCGNLLTPKLQKIWRQRCMEDLVPVTQRVYCPNPRCSALMSVTELSIVKPTEEESGVRKSCVRCREPFCMNCKVPWHNNLSCDKYKTLCPNPIADDTMLKDLANQNMWRQCSRCQNMIELSQGCASVTCRCGADAGGCSHGHNFYDLRTGRLLFRPWCAALWFSVLLVMAASIVGFLIFLIIHFVRYLVLNTHFTPIECLLQEAQLATNFDGCYLFIASIALSQSLPNVPLILVHRLFTVDFKKVWIYFQRFKDETFQKLCRLNKYGGDTIKKKG